MHSSLSFTPIFRVDRDGPTAVVSVFGDLDVATEQELRAKLDELRADLVPVVLDLGDVPFMDSRGLSLLIGATRDAARDGWRFAVAPAVSAPVAQLLELTRVGEHLTFAAA